MNKEGQEIMGDLRMELEKKDNIIKNLQELESKLEKMVVYWREEYHVALYERDQADNKVIEQDAEINQMKLELGLS
tara:strand:- start:1301 stop:1528 length:228 start_codon:yes stop_codon:yes gene_type:complete